MDMPIRFVFSQIMYYRNKKIRPLMSDLGLTSGQPKILDYLSFHEGCTQKEIAKGCGVEPATVSDLLNGLVKKGYIEKRTAKENRRELHVYFTELGRHKHSEVRAAIDAVEAESMGSLTEEEMKVFRTLLDKYYQAWCD